MLIFAEASTYVISKLTYDFLFIQLQESQGQLSPQQFEEKAKLISDRITKQFSDHERVKDCEDKEMVK